MSRRDSKVQSLGAADEGPDRTPFFVLSGFRPTATVYSGAYVTLVIAEDLLRELVVQTSETTFQHPLDAPIARNRSGACPRTISARDLMVRDDHVSSIWSPDMYVLRSRLYCGRVSGCICEQIAHRAKMGYAHDEICGLPDVPARIQHDLDHQIPLKSGACRLPGRQGGHRHTEPGTVENVWAPRPVMRIGYRRIRAFRLNSTDLAPCPVGIDPIVVPPHQHRAVPRVRGQYGEHRAPAQYPFLPREEVGEKVIRIEASCVQYPLKLLHNGRVYPLNHLSALASERHNVRFGFRNRKVSYGQPPLSTNLIVRSPKCPLFHNTSSLQGKFNTLTDRRLSDLS